MAGRTLQEKLVDRFLLLYQIQDAFKYINFLSETKLQKIVFLSEKSMLDEREKGFNYNYIKLIHGTYSPELSDDLTEVAEIGLIDDYGLKPATPMISILEDFGDLFERNSIFLKKIEEINRTFVRMSLEEILNFVYNMPHPYLKPERKIKDLKLTTPILYRIPLEKATKIFEITPEETEELEMSLNPSIIESMRRAMNDLRANRLRTHEEVFGELRR